MSAGRQPIHVRGEVGAQGAALGSARGDVVVVVDALRASATITAALVAGARRVIAVRTVEEAVTYLDDPHCRVAGERGGKRLRELHYGNSPTEILRHRHELIGRTLVLTTSNGTRCIDAALPGVYRLLVGSTVNATAVARTALTLAQTGGRQITLVNVGYNGHPSPEDSFAVRLIATRLRAMGAVPGAKLSPVDDADSLEVFLASEAATRLRALGYERDVYFCAQVDKWTITPVYDTSRHGFVV